MLLQAAVDILGNPCIEGSVRTAEDIDKPLVLVSQNGILPNFFEPVTMKNGKRLVSFVFPPENRVREESENKV